MVADRLRRAERERLEAHDRVSRVGMTEKSARCGRVKKSVMEVLHAPEWLNRR